MKLKLTWLMTLFMAFVMQVSLAQEKTVSGAVTSVSDGLPLPGVSIIVKGTTRGVQTDFDGNYTISVRVGETLRFSFVSMKSTEVVVGASNTVNVALDEDVAALDEVVIVGYGSTSKKDLTGAVSTIETSQLQDIPVSSVEQALQGKTSGLQIVSAGGRSGNNTQISIRGNGSLSASNSALYVIDGVPQESMNGISAEDIKSISVLKDAASTAIYGSRASNGVILIQTNSGSYNKEVSVAFSTSYGFQNAVKKEKLLNAAQYKQVLDASRVNYENDIAAGNLPAPQNPSTLNPLPASNYDTNWLDLVLRKDAVIRKNQFSISGGGANTKSYFSASLFDQDGIIKDDSYKVARLKLNIEQKMNEHISYGVTSYFAYSEAVPMVDDNNTYQPYSKALEARPDQRPYDDEGKIAGIQGSNNPLYAFERIISDKWQDVGATVYFDIAPIENLVWHSSLSGNIRSNRYNRFDAPDTKRGLNGDGVPTGYGYYSTQNNRDYLIENTITFNETFFNDNLKAELLVGHSFQNWTYEDSYLQGEKFPSNDLHWLISAGEVNSGRSYIKSMALESYFSRLQLSWASKYHLMVSTRYDGSSKFTTDNRWGSFPAISGGWTVSNEDFFNVEAINALKVRASFGYTGNQSGIAYSSGQNLIGSGENYDLSPGLAATSIFNENLKWEKGKASNIGLDLTLFNNRVELNLDYYKKETQDLLSRVNVPQESGFRTMLANVGNIRNEGFEVNLNTTIINNDTFKWNFGANFSHNKNEVLKVGSETGQYTTGFVSIVKEGESLGSFYLLEANGIAQEKFTYKDKNGVDGYTVQAGDMLYVDQNGDGKIDDQDRKVFEGGIAPIYGGLNTVFQFKGFDLGVNAQYSLGKKVFAFYKKDLLNGGAVGGPSYSGNMSTEMLDYWTPTNTNTSVPRPHMNSTISEWNGRNSSRFLENADYLRISDITLGYNFVFLKDTKINFIESLRVYAQLRNPFTFTKYSGADPETNYVDQTVNSGQDRTDGSKISSGVDLGGVPNVKSFLLGMNVKF